MKACDMCASIKKITKASHSMTITKADGPDQIYNVIYRNDLCFDCWNRIKNLMAGEEEKK